MPNSPTASAFETYHQSLKQSFSALPRFQSLSADILESLRANEVVSSPRKLDLSELVSAGNCALRKYDLELTRLYTMIDAIQRDRDELRNHVVTCHSNFAPIRRLPNEILGEVFRCCVLYNVAYDKRTDFGPQMDVTPLKLSHVCTHWREVAFSINTLWSRIWMDVLQQEMPDPKFPPWRVKSALEFILERASGAPLDIVLRFVGDNPPARHDVVEALAQHSTPRWRKLNLTLSCLDDYEALYNYKGSFTLLDTLKISDDFRENDGLTLFDDAPCLRSVEINNGHWILPWSQLFHLEYSLYFSSSNALVATLSACTSLRSLSVFVIHDVPVSDLHNSDGVFTPSPAKSLAICDVNLRLTGIKYLFTRLTMPFLTSLELEGGSDPIIDRTMERELDAFILRSGCVITSLILVRMGFTDPAAFMSFLRTLPNLTHLKCNFDINAPERTLGLCQALTVGANPVMILPCLTELDLAVNWDTEFDDEAFVKMVLSRWHPPSAVLTSGEKRTVGIQSVFLRARRVEFPDKWIEELWYRRSAGLKIEIVDAIGPLFDRKALVY